MIIIILYKLWSYKFNLKVHKRVDCLFPIWWVCPIKTIWNAVSLLVNLNPIIVTVYQTIRGRAAGCCPQPSPEPSLMASPAHCAEQNLSLQYTTVQQKDNKVCVLCVWILCSSVMLECKVSERTQSVGECQYCYFFSSVRCSQRKTHERGTEL